MLTQITTRHSQYLTPKPTHCWVFDIGDFISNRWPFTMLKSLFTIHNSQFFHSSIQWRNMAFAGVNSERPCLFNSAGVSLKEQSVVYGWRQPSILRGQSVCAKKISTFKAFHCWGVESSFGRSLVCFQCIHSLRPWYSVPTIQIENNSILSPGPIN